MYAIIRLGNHQFRVEKGETFAVDRIEAKKGSSLDVTDVLFAADGANVKIGQPNVKGAKVVLDILKDDQKGPKVRFTKFDRTDNYRRKKGHRQAQTLVRVKDIVL